MSRYFRKSRRFEAERACKGNIVDIPWTRLREDACRSGEVGRTVASSIERNRKVSNIT